MCLIVVKPIGVTLDENDLRSGFEKNPDGAGYMFTSGGKVRLKKGYFNFYNFYEELRSDLEANEKTSPFVIHFRLATRGYVNTSNCQPFRINSGLAFAHNGVLFGLDGYPKTQSDTAAFKNQILKNLPLGFHKHKAILTLLEIAISKLNKFVFLDNNGSIVILNEREGIWEDGLWYSNDSYKPIKQWFWLTEGVIEIAGKNTFCTRCYTEVEFTELYTTSSGKLCWNCAQETFYDEEGG
jgi:hypothetical protein